jgi:hypothetical protein
MAKLEPVRLFATPESIEDIMQLIENLPAKHRAVGMTIAMFTWNLACKLITETEDDDDEDN